MPAQVGYEGYRDTVYIVLEQLPYLVQLPLRLGQVFLQSRRECGVQIYMGSIDLSSGRVAVICLTLH